MKKRALNLCLLGLITLLAVPSHAAPPQWVRGLVTTTPVQQDRDRVVYNWQQRHAQVLARNRKFPAQVVVIGDSLIHYWGGKPAAPRTVAQEAWERCFANMTVANLGFGWDRTENVLWRLEHGELDHLDPAAIVLLIGTNNVSAHHKPLDIVAGIEAILALVHKKKPDAKVLLLGLLPRRDEPQKAATPPITDQVNQLLRTRLSDVPWVTQLDVGRELRKVDGQVDAALYADPVHLNATGYAVLGPKLRQQLTRLLSP